MCVIYRISTHTLTWSVTKDWSEQAEEREFQLTRSRGAWPYSLCRWSLQGYFNSHAHVERDNWHCFLLSALYHFNSHAHVERDLRSNFLSICLGYFNSHAHVERDLSAALFCRSFIFQLTRSRGAWLCRQVWRTWFLHFNSHAHVERDN